MKKSMKDEIKGKFHEVKGKVKVSWRSSAVAAVPSFWPD